MFSKKEVKQALTWLFCLYDIVGVEILGTDFETVPEVVNSLAPDVLARKFKKDAQKVKSFLVSTGPTDEGTFYGNDLFPSKAVCLCAVEPQTVKTERLRIMSVSELWLLSNLKFAHVHCDRVYTLDGEEATSITDCRNLVGFIKNKTDLFVDAQTLFEELDDTALFADLLAKREGDENQ